MSFGSGSQLDRIEAMVRALCDALQIATPPQAGLRLDTAKIDQLREEIGFVLSPGVRDLREMLAMHDAIPGIPLPPPREPGSAHLVNGNLPDPAVTPGATNPDVTEETLAATIGTPGWTATIRPPVAYTDALKLIQMRWYGLDGDPADYEEDHLIPLCCGGHPTDWRNLWPQSRTGVWSARVKDLTEVAGQHAVLGKQLSLQQVQFGFQHDWTVLHDELFRNPVVVKEMIAAGTYHDDEP